MQRSETIGTIASAMAKANLEIKNPELDGVNPHYKSRFATLAAVLNAVRSPLAKQGIAILQPVTMDGNFVAVTTTLAHASGEWISETLSYPLPDRSTVQQIGSTVSYLRRYSLISFCGLVGEDDDGDSDRQAPTEDRKPFKPQNARGAAPAQGKPQAAPTAEAAPKEATAPASGVADAFPDEGDFLVRVNKVVRRKGKPTAVQVTSAIHGACYASTLVEGYADYLESITGEIVTLGLNRNGLILEITHVTYPPTPVKLEDF